jgi:hypothetical protein
VAKIHPSLLADPNQPENILYACGVGSPVNPRSVLAKTVFARCSAAIPEFTEREVKIAMSMMERRNEELHSGKAAFEEFPTRIWLPDYYRIASILLRFQAKELQDFLGPDEAQAALSMIRAAEARVLAEVSERVAERRRSFQGLSEEEKNSRHLRARAIVEGSLGGFGKETACPACAGASLITGEQVRASEPRLEEREIVREIAILPTRLRCPSCELRLENHEEIHAAGLGGQYTLLHREPAEEYLYAGDYEEYMNE